MTTVSLTRAGRCPPWGPIPPTQQFTVAAAAAATTASIHPHESEHPHMPARVPARLQGRLGPTPGGGAHLCDAELGDGVQKVVRCAPHRGAQPRSCAAGACGQAHSVAQQLALSGAVLLGCPGQPTAGLRAGKRCVHVASTRHELAPWWPPWQRPWRSRVRAHCVPTDPPPSPTPTSTPTQQVPRLQAADLFWQREGARGQATGLEQAQRIPRLHHLVHPRTAGTVPHAAANPAPLLSQAGGLLSPPAVGELAGQFWLRCHAVALLAFAALQLLSSC